jgi:enterochelin esterase-like enzyme
VTNRLRTVLLGLAVVAVAATVSAQSTARTVRIETTDMGQRVFAVLLPNGYEESTKRYPVLYLLHGGGQDHTAFMARPRFAARARRFEMIVVMPAADRGSPQPTVVARYQDFLARDLVAYIDANYRTVGSPAARAIAGLSMGGMYASSTGLRYPQIFGNVGAFSAAVLRTAIAPAAESDAMPYFYLSCGTLDNLLPASRQLQALVKERNLPHEYHEIPGFDHSWSFWDPQIDAYFELLASRPGWSAQ